MKKIPLIALAVILPCVWGCQPTGQKNTVFVEDIEDIEPAVISFDESTGEASIDKNFYFLFDVSGSMGDYCANERKIDGAKKAIYEFLKKVPDDVNIGLLFFGVENEEYGIQEVVPLGKGNKDAFYNQVANTRPQSGTPLSNATYFGRQRLIDQYKKQLGYGDYRLIIITDGMASYPEEFAYQLKECKRYPFIAIYGIGLCIDGKHLLKSYSLTYTDAHNYEELGKALVETIAESEDFDPADFDPTTFNE
jgi:Ca-activated chloride channel homolog